MNFSTTLLGLFITLLMPRFAVAQEIKFARAAELGCHRLERLFDLGRIDQGYIDHFQGLKIAASQEAGAKFQWIGQQAPGADGSFSQIELQEDASGKFLGTPKETTGAASTSPVWPDKDPVTLMENALHYVLDNGPGGSDLAPFFNSLTEGTLSSAQVDGQTVAIVQLKNSENTSILEATLRADGTLIGVQYK